MKYRKRQVKIFVVDPRVNGKITRSPPSRLKKARYIRCSCQYLVCWDIQLFQVVSREDHANMESGEQATRVATRANPGVGDEV